MNSKGWVVRLMEAVPTGPDLSEVPQVWANVYLYPAIHYPSIAEFSYEDIPFYESELMLGTSLVYMDQGGYRYVVLK